MTDTDPVPYLDGHCSSRGRPDQFHALCPREIRTQFGVLKRCSCSRHEEDEKEAIG